MDNVIVDRSPIENNHRYNEVVTINPVQTDPLQVISWVSSMSKRIKSKDKFRIKGGNSLKIRLFLVEI